MKAGGVASVVHACPKMKKKLCNANPGVVRRDPRAAGQSEGARFLITPIATQLSTLSVMVLALAASGCGTRHATLNFTAPSTTTAGTPFTVTVTVMIGTELDTIIDNRVHFTSSDPAAILPGDYYFTRADAGSHTWINGFVLATSGNQTISGEIIEATGISGSANIAVAP